MHRLKKDATIEVNTLKINSMSTFSYTPMQTSMTTTSGFLASQAGHSANATAGRAYTGVGTAARTTVSNTYKATEFQVRGNLSARAIQQEILQPYQVSGLTTEVSPLKAPGRPGVPNSPNGNGRPGTEQVGGLAPIGDAVLPLLVMAFAYGMIFVRKMRKAARA